MRRFFNVFRTKTQSRSDKAFSCPARPWLGPILVGCLCAGVATPSVAAEPAVGSTSPSGSPALTSRPAAAGANSTEGGSSAPYGYHVERSPRWSFVGVGGGIALVGGVLALGSWASTKKCSGTANPEGCDNANQDKAGPMFAGAALAASGLVLAGVGLFWQRETFVADQQSGWTGTPFRPDTVKVSVLPVGTGTGVNLALTF